MMKSQRFVLRRSPDARGPMDARDDKEMKP